MSGIGRRWCFTLNNYDEAELDTLRTSLSKKEEVRYAIFGFEIGEEGTAHLQGYVSFTKNKRLKGAKRLVGDRAHVEMAKGSEEQNYVYCSKEGKFEEFGSRSKGGVRTDLDRFKEAVKSGTLDKKTLREEHSEVAAKYPRFFDNYVTDNKVPVPVRHHVLNDWQKSLRERLILPPNDRDIIFIVDREGGKGKTWFAKYWCSIYDNAQMLEPGKRADMAYALRDDIRYLFVNVTREKQETLQYSFLEAVKDGVVFSPKYESGIKSLGPCHVVVMMNMHPEEEKLSQDRVKITSI